MFGGIFLLAVGLFTARGVVSNYNYDDYDGDYVNLCQQSCFAPDIPDGTILDSNNVTKDDFAAGERARLVCKDGYMVRGQGEALCQDDCTWSWSLEPFCVPRPPPPARCTTKKTLPDEGMYIDREETITETTNTYFSKLIIRCYEDRDYYLYGGGTEGEYVCQGTEWEGSHFCLKKRVCPRIRIPKNGYLAFGDENSRRVGSEIYFACNSGYHLRGPNRDICLSTLHWSSSFDVYCEEELGLQGVAKTIKESVDRYKAQSSTSTSSIGRLSASHDVGIDLFFVVDRSDSIAEDDFKMAMKFVKTLVGFFGVSSRKGGTRISVITFGTEAEVHLSFYQIRKMEECIIKAKQDKKDIIQDYNACKNQPGDPFSQMHSTCFTNLTLSDPLPDGVNGTEVQMTLGALIKDKLDDIQPLGGGTNIINALQEVRKMRVRCNAEKATFLLSDGRDNAVTDFELDANLQGIRRIGERDRQFMEIFAVGIGQDLQMDQLEKIATEPKERHHFQLRDYQQLKNLTDLIIVAKNDYDQCGVSLPQRNGEVSLNASDVQEAKRHSWPWLVKISVDQGFRCGGALIAKNFVLTAASCLFNDDGELLRPKGGFTPVDVSVGYFRDVDEGNDTRTADNGTQTACDLFVHPKYNHTQPLKNNIALVKIKDGLEFSPVLRRVCLPDIADESLIQKTDVDRWLVGWNTALSTIHPEITKTKVPYERTMDSHTKRLCNNEHPETARDSYLTCIGDRHQKRDHCAGDKGAPLVVKRWDIDGKPIYKMIAMVTDGTQCMKHGKFTVVTEIVPFINWINVVISQNKNCSSLSGGHVGG